MSRAEAGEVALRALEHLAAAARIGDFVYQVRETEGEGWNGPRTQSWGVGVTLADQALDMAGVKIPAPFPRPAFGLMPTYYVFPERSEADRPAGGRTEEPAPRG